MTDQRLGGRAEFVHHWETVAVTPLAAGWTNVYSDPDGGELRSDCPALLLQELRAISCVRDVHGRGRTTSEEPPYATRVVFAESEGTGCLVEANEAANYLRTEGPTGPDAA